MNDLLLKESIQTVVELKTNYTILIGITSENKVRLHFLIKKTCMTQNCIINYFH